MEVISPSRNCDSPLQNNPPQLVAWRVSGSDSEMDAIPEQAVELVWNMDPIPWSYEIPLESGVQRTTEEFSEGLKIIQLKG